MPTMTADEQWREALVGGPTIYRAARRIWKRMPGTPRCRNCTAPFAGPVAVVTRALGFTPWPRNPTFCNRCLPGIAARGLGGAEVELSMIFADVRGSTSIAESMPPTAFATMLQRFYAASTEVLVRHDAMVDAYIGDEVTGLFIPAFAGPNHAEDAIAAGRDLLRSLGNGTPEGAWIPVGVAVHTGNAYVGAVGAEGKFMDVKALGDSVNTAARLASSAAAGEMLVSDTAAAAGSLRTNGLEHRDLTLKGKADVIGAYVVHA